MRITRLLLPLVVVGSAVGASLASEFNALFERDGFWRPAVTGQVVASIDRTLAPDEIQGLEGFALRPGPRLVLYGSTEDTFVTLRDETAPDLQAVLNSASSRIILKVTAEWVQRQAPFRFCGGMRGRTETARVGSCVRRPGGPGGTLTMRAEDVTSDGERSFALTSAHVLAPTRTDAEPDLLRPGRWRSGGNRSSEVDRLGRLTRWRPIKPITDETAALRPLNTVDAGTAAVVDRDAVLNETPPDGFGPIAAGVTTVFDLEFPHAVMKYGQSTGSRSGSIVGLAFRKLIDPVTARSAWFSGYEIVDHDLPFARCGDSGSLVVSASDMKPMALLIGTDGERHLATPIEWVLDCLQLDVAGRVAKTSCTHPSALTYLDRAPEPCRPVSEAQNALAQLRSTSNRIRSVEACECVWTHGTCLRATVTDLDFEIDAKVGVYPVEVIVELEQPLSQGAAPP